MQRLRQRTKRIGGIAALLALAQLGCDGSNPVAPVGAGEPAPATTYTVSLSANPPTAIANVTVSVTITVTVVQNPSGAAPDSSAMISVSTSLGTLTKGSESGSLLTVQVDGKDTTLTLDPGQVSGMAEILARIDDSAGNTMVEVKDPPDPPVAAFEFEAEGLKVFFLDKSTGDPTAWYWSFDDMAATCPDPTEKNPAAVCTEQNPTYTYAEDDSGKHKVSLTVTNVGDTVADSSSDFQSSQTQFVTVAETIFITKVEPNTGAAEGGETVVITGTGGFREPLRVFFGNKLATVESVTSTEIEATTPPGDLQQVACDGNSDGNVLGLIFLDTPVQLVVELEDGTQETLENAFTYKAPVDNPCLGDPEP